MREFIRVVPGEKARQTGLLGAGRKRALVLSVIARIDTGLVRPPIVFYAFDLLQLNGTDLQGPAIVGLGGNLRG
jgi:hypothetical protein